MNSSQWFKVILEVVRIVVAALAGASGSSLVG